MTQNHRTGMLGSSPNEETLRREIAYCKARLTDIDNAPQNSRHKEGRARVLSHLKECQRLLARLNEN